jgi:hypothetical protein
MTQSEMTLTIVKGVTDHFKLKTVDLPFYPQGLVKENSNLPAWAELRLVGPDYTNFDGYFDCNITCNVLISTKIEEMKEDYLAHLKNTVKAQKPFDYKTIQLDSVGSSDSGDCLVQDGITRIRNYGSTDNNNLVVHSIIENSYYIQKRY